MSADWLADVERITNRLRTLTAAQWAAPLRPPLGAGLEMQTAETAEHEARELVRILVAAVVSAAPTTADAYAHHVEQFGLADQIKVLAREVAEFSTAPNEQIAAECARLARYV